MSSSFCGTGSRRANVGCARKASWDCGIESGPRPGAIGATRSRTSLPRSIHSCVAGSAISNMPHRYTFSSVDGFVRRRLRAILRRQLHRPGQGRCLRDHTHCPNAFFANLALLTMSEALRLARNPDVKTTDWRGRRGKTAHRVWREGTAIAVSYPYSRIRRRYSHFRKGPLRRNSHDAAAT
jgi:hypothetical protein